MFTKNRKKDFAITLKMPKRPFFLKKWIFCGLLNLYFVFAETQIFTSYTSYYPNSGKSRRARSRFANLNTNYNSTKHLSVCFGAVWHVWIIITIFHLFDQHFATCKWIKKWVTLLSSYLWQCTSVYSVLNVDNTWQQHWTELSKYNTVNTSACGCNLVFVSSYRPIMTRSIISVVIFIKLES